MQMNGPREASRVFIGGWGKMTDGKDEIFGEVSFDQMHVINVRVRRNGENRG